MRLAWLCWLVCAQAPTDLDRSVETTQEAREAGDKALDAIFELYKTDVVSTGSFLDLTVRQSSASLTIITREQIAASGARNLTELLEIFVPGFQYAIGKWNSAPLWGLRGLMTQDMAFIFLVNGLKENLQSRSDPALETILGLMQDIERVEVLRGPAGLAYGDAALAGVVNVVTRTPSTNMAEVRLGGGLRNVEIEAFSNSQLGEDNNLALSAGFMRDWGVGLHQARIYGQGSYPTTTNIYHADGIPTEGSAMALPANLRAGFDWRFHDLRVWGRWTHQGFPNAGFFAQDPWPSIVGAPSSKAPPGQVDGMNVPPTGPWAPVDSLGLGRTVFANDSFSVLAHYALHLDEDRLEIDLAWNGATERLYQDLLSTFAVPTAVSNRPAGEIYTTFGERRYNASVRYLLKRVEHLQSGSGIQFRVDDIGADLEGFNFYNSIAKHTAIMPVIYTSVAVFSENMYWFNDMFAAEVGLRADYHSRVGLQFNPKAAMLFLPNEDHVVKLIVQSSTGNNSAFNLEYNYYHFSDTGTINTTSTLASPTGITVIPPATLETLHSLQAERSLSIELLSSHRLFNNSFTITPSISYNRLLNLFEFSQELFICVNAGQYDALSAEIDLAYDLEFLHIGANHAFQRPFGNHSGAQTFKIPKTIVSPAANSTFTVTEVPGVTNSVRVDAIGDAVTADDTNFLNLATHVTKVWATVSPFSWLGVHANVRIMWGYPGRQSIWQQDEAHGENYLQVATLPVIKLNAGVTAALPWGFVASAFAYDLLGGSHGRNAVRLQQHPTSDYKEIYTSDQPTFLIRLEKSI